MRLLSSELLSLWANAVLEAITAASRGSSNPEDELVSISEGKIGSSEFALGVVDGEVASTAFVSDGLLVSVDGTWVGTPEVALGVGVAVRLVSRVAVG